jgi:transposase-like protein
MSKFTPEEKKEICRKTRERIPQKQIAQEFNCTVYTIRKVQKAAGLKLFREIAPELETKIVAHLRKGHGQLSTSRFFRVSFHKIRPLMRKHNIVHSAGNQGLPRELREKISKAVANREDYCVRIALRFGVSRTAVQKIAHEIHGPARMLNGPAWPPLQSRFPQTNRKRQS